MCVCMCVCVLSVLFLFCYRKAPENEEEMMVAIFEYIDRIFNIVRPRRLLYMAVDGVVSPTFRFPLLISSYSQCLEIFLLKHICGKFLILLTFG